MRKRAFLYPARLDHLFLTVLHSRSIIPVFEPGLEPFLKQAQKKKERTICLSFLSFADLLLFLYSLPEGWLEQELPGFAGVALWPELAGLGLEEKRYWLRHPALVRRRSFHPGRHRVLVPA